MKRMTPTGALVLCGLLFGLVAPAPATATASATTLVPGFEEVTSFSGLTQPTVVKFASDGRVFVAEKSGLIKIYDGLSDTTATVFADLSTNVYNFWDRGLLGMVLDPNFPTNPYIYVLYTYDAPIGGTAPRWGTSGVLSDPCPTPPGATDDGCVVSGRLSRLQVSGNVLSGAEQVLINDWCQQYPSHSIGGLSFGADGMLYVTGGDGASFTITDYGQDGSPKNPCGDPGGPNPTPPTAEGGSLRSQDVRTTGDPLGLNGTVVRVNPSTGAGVAGNPLFSSTDPNARRIVAAGLRNPFRIAHRPGTNDTFIGDVGGGSYEEIYRISNPADGSLRNFGWPCYEGNGRNAAFDGADLNICENLYAAGSTAVTPPLYAYAHTDSVVPGDSCPVGSSSISGTAFEFYSGNAYPPAYQGALFFSDYSRKCIWVMMPGTNGLPNPANIQTFVSPAVGGPVHLEISPAGELFYAAFDTGQIRRIQYSVPPPVTCSTGEFKAEYFIGVAPGTTPNLSRCEPAIDNAWGLGGPGNGLADDHFSTRWTGTHNFTAGTYYFTSTSDDGVRVWVDNTLVIDNWTDHGTTVDVGIRTLTAGTHDIKMEYYENAGEAVAKLSWAASTTPQAPTATINTPTDGTTWQVNTNLGFTGTATDPQQGTLPATALTWELVMQHCPSNCHSHSLQTWTGVASGTFTAPDHEYPSHLDLRLTARDANGNTDTTTRRLDPQTVVLTFQSNPTGLQLTVGGTFGAAPITRTVIIGSNNSLSANTPQSVGGNSYAFLNWSDSGAQTHTIVAPPTPTTYTANFGQFGPYARINFQPAGAPLFPGYMADTGGTYGSQNGFAFGWNKKMDNATADRNSPLSPDQRYDTFILTQQAANRSWEIAVPNGTYRVRMVCGEPTRFDGTYRFNVETVRACDASPTTTNRWVDTTVIVSVTDGKLSVTNAVGASNNRLAFLDIDRAI